MGGAFASLPGRAGPQALERARRVRLVALDVDGTLTDGSILVGPGGEAMKRFSVHDGFGLRLLREAGLELAIVTGRRSSIVETRAAELGIVRVAQAVSDKTAALAAICADAGLALADAAFVGDDWPDLAVMRAAGFAAAVADAAPEVVAVAHWVSGAPGGHGAVRQFAEWLLAAQGRLDAARQLYLGSGGGVA